MVHALIKDEAVSSILARTGSRPDYFSVLGTRTSMTSRFLYSYFTILESILLRPRLLLSLYRFIYSVDMSGVSLVSFVELMAIEKRMAT